MNSRLRMITVGVIIPALIVIIGVVTLAVVAPTLPDPIAVHWGPNGEVDGFGSLWFAFVLPPVVVIGYAILALAASRIDDGRVTPNQKLIVTIAPFLASVITIIVVGSVVIQSGLAEAKDAPSIVPVMLLALGIGILLALAGWFVLPRTTPRQDTPAQRPVLDLTDASRATWMRRVGPSHVLAAFAIGILVIALVGGGVIVWTVGPVVAALVYVVGLAIVLVLVVGSLYWRVTVDSRGFRAISVLGLPRYVYPIASISSAAVIEVQPAVDFGGWGIRWGGKGRLGLILRSGEALEVNRTDGKAFVVTVDDAANAAGLLNALVARR